jgi:type I protein arginine methyltransferase
VRVCDLSGRPSVAAGTMYNLHDYTWMITDEGRMGPYVRALEAVVQAGSVVVDIGTGAGILALIACRLGARRVYAIDTNDAIEVGRELARENGVADRIVFLQRDAREVELPERADVIVSDLRGMLPLSGDHLAIMADVRGRFLKPGGVLIPARDRLMVAVVEQPDVYEWALGPARGPLGITLEAMRARLQHATCADRGSNPLRPENVVSTAAAWATLDYATVQPVPIAGSADLQVKRGGTAHGLVLWFEAVLAGEHGFTTAPGQELCYGRLFLPWPRQVAVSEGDRVTVDLWAHPHGDPWGWNSVVTRRAGPREAFKQSSFLGFTGKLTPRSSVGRGRTFSQTSQS